jgi:hypothetical protein
VTEYARGLRIAETWIAATGTTDEDILSVTVTRSHYCPAKGGLGKGMVVFHVSWGRFDALLASGAIGDLNEVVTEVGSFHRYARTPVGPDEFVGVTCCGNAPP